MTRDPASSVLTINGGSSSIKFALFDGADPPRRLHAGSIDRVGLPDAALAVRGQDGATSRQPIGAPGHAAAVARLLRWLDEAVGLESVAAVGHRIVHGGSRHFDPEAVTPDLIESLRSIIPLDPAHLPGEIELIEAFSQHAPKLRQVVCFDTAFHKNLPTVARLLPIPRRYDAMGVRKYGFHGLSYTYLMGELARVAGTSAANGKVVLAHLGSGASLAAVRDGKCVDTTMGFTPTAGTVMGTRTGDLDPGVLTYLLRSEKWDADRLDEMVNKKSGLLGVSETSPDMRDLAARRDTDPRAAEAIDLFCYSVRKWIGALAAALGGVDTLVFSGGIGENDPNARQGICKGLDFLGLRIDQSRNAAGAALISADGSGCAVRVLRTDEEVVIAGAVRRVLLKASCEL